MACRKRLPGLLLATLACWALSGCFPRSDAADEAVVGTRPLKIVCTTGQVAELVARVGGSQVEVQALMGYGVDPHLYKPSHSDLRKLRTAEAVFYNGLHLEGRLGEVLEKLARSRPTLAVTEGLVQQHRDRLRATAAFAGHFDPHVWFDLELWAQTTESVAEQLTALRPLHADEFQDRARTYREELVALARESRELLAAIPLEQRVLVTAHDAFEYFGRSMEVEVHALQGISTADETDLVTLDRLVRLLTQRKIKAVFVESSVPPKFVEALVEGCQSQGHPIRIGGELYSDALGPPGSGAETLVGMFRHNVSTIAAALK